jgi:hypothetical protein
LLQYDPAFIPPPKAKPHPFILISEAVGKKLTQVLF